MSKLIVLSNRVSNPNPSKPIAGGLAVALQNALNEQGGTWMGWNGEITETQHYKPQFQTIKKGMIEYVTTPLTKMQYQHFYCGFANNMLWPAMHERVDLVSLSDKDYEVYQQVNQMFAQQIYAIAQPDDYIWIHDYHFLSVAHYCRKLGMKNRIGFFLHIPFVSLNIWQQFEQTEELMHQLACYDVIGLQTPTDQKNCKKVLAYYLPQPTLSLAHVPSTQKTKSSIVTANGHKVQVNCYPIGVNVQMIQQMAFSEHNKLNADQFAKQNWKNTIVSVDRIDYAKGLPERFNALQLFLHRHPYYQQQLQLLQVACACRMDIATYHSFYDQVHQQIDQINQSFGRDDWQPIQCISEALAHEELMQIFNRSKIGWVNSLKDGMNLVAKEYIAAQFPEDPGVLLLSKYAGAAKQMDAAIIVDPLQPQSMVKGLYKALNMSLVERKVRYQELIRGLRTYNIRDWRNSFLQDLKTTPTKDVVLLKEISA